MGGAGIEHLDGFIAHRDDLFVLKRAGRAHRLGAFPVFLRIALHTFEKLTGVFLELMGGIHMGQNLDALIDPIVVAQHRVALTVLVDHKFYGVGR